MFDSENQLIGVFCDEQYTAGEYVISVSQITNGYKVTITKGDTVQEMTLKNGEDPDLTEMNALMNTLRDASSGYATAEAARVAAEKLREEAENGPTEKEDPESDEDKAKYRSGLYQLMLALYNKYYPTVDDDLAAVEAAKTAAEAAKTAAETAASQAQAVVLSDFATQIYYYDGDVLKFEDVDSEDEVVVTDGYSAQCCFIGYVTDSRKTLHLKFPVAKHLNNISSIKCNSMMMNISNSGGYAAKSSFVSGGVQYKDMIKQIIIDKVQDCIHVVLKRTDGSAFNLTNNECVNARVGKGTDDYSAVQFTLYGVSAPDKDSSNAADSEATT